MEVIFIILSVLGSAAPTVVQAMKRKQYISLDEARLAITKSMNAAYSLGQTKLDELTNKLTNLQFIQRTPALEDAINQTADKLKQRAQSLRNEMAEIEINAIKAENQANRAEDENIFKIKKATKQAIKEAENYVQKTEKNKQNILEVERRIR